MLQLVSEDLLRDAAPSKTGVIATPPKDVSLDKAGDNTGIGLEWAGMYFQGRI